MLNQYQNMIEDNALNVPHISNELAEYLKEEFSADKQLASGLLSDPNVTRSEPYLLGFLAGLGLARRIIECMIINQDSQFAELEDVTDNYLSGSN